MRFLITSKPKFPVPPEAAAILTEMPFMAFSDTHAEAIVPEVGLKNFEDAMQKMTPVSR